ncbi:hypothetical protein F5Y13DRAFT_29082 [Hypoxylon sp. FL1857]|nr:hypothetical protein F5Y13DRAFT_29082 [Hypoxylon sp. FL1857]
MTTATKTPKNVLGDTARKIYRAVGFSKWYNFWFWLLLGGGGLLYFTVARLNYIDFYGTFCGASSGHGDRDLASPGECFYHLDGGWYQFWIIAHLACILPASILACVQFIPIARRKAMWLHRISGWISTVLGIIGAIAAVMLSPHSMGGGVDTISMVGAQGIFFTGSLIMGIINAKRHNVAKHRAWMLRSWVIGGAIITMRHFMTITMILASLNGGYYYAQPCEKISFMLGGEDATMASYPECAPYFSGQDPKRHVAVHATVFNRDKVKIAAAVNMVFGMAGWMAIILHILLVECYLRYESGGSKASPRQQVAVGTKKADVAANTDAIKVD